MSEADYSRHTHSLEGDKADVFYQCTVVRNYRRARSFAKMSSDEFQNAVRYLPKVIRYVKFDSKGRASYISDVLRFAYEVRNVAHTGIVDLEEEISTNKLPPDNKIIPDEELDDMPLISPDALEDASN